MSEEGIILHEAKMSSNFDKQIMKHGDRQEMQELEELIKSIPAENLANAITNKLEGSEAINFWNYLLKGFTSDYESKEKRFKCVQALLNKLTTFEMTYKHTELIRRLCVEIPSFLDDHLIKITEFALDCIKSGDPKCAWWKDLFPEVISYLSEQDELFVNDVRLTGSQYSSSILQQLCTINWQPNILTAIANMFKNMDFLNNENIYTILAKFCCGMQRLDPLELPTLAFHLFSLSNTASHIITPVIALNKYFYKNYYKKLLQPTGNESTDSDVIVEHSDKELREAEETILNHLTFCSQSRISEAQICHVLRKLTAAPDFILTPFLISSLLAMTQINRDPDSRISSSLILYYLRNVIKNSNKEITLKNKSAWCRECLQTNQPNLEQIFTILIDQNKEGKDAITPGLVNLAFVLLKTKNSPKLNNLGISFLQVFIKKRYVFGKGIIQTIADWMIIEQDNLQFSECLTILSVSDTYTFSECEDTIAYILDFLLQIPGQTAMRIMNFILPVVRTSYTIRNLLLDILKKAIYSRNMETCRMGVYGYCMLLRQFNNRSSQRYALGARGILTQQTISGCAILQSTLADRTNPRRQLDLLTLDIIGILRICFNQNVEIKEMLYEGLFRAIELNPLVTSNVLKFVEVYFGKYFNITESICEVKFEKVIFSDRNNSDIEITDNLGQLTKLVAFCVITCANEKLAYNTKTLKKMFSTLINKISSKELNIEDMTGEIDNVKTLLTVQKLNFLEALMFYIIWISKITNEDLEKISKLFTIHYNMREDFKKIQSKKESKKSHDKTTQYQSVAASSVVAKKVSSKLENIWDLPTIEKFLRLVYEDSASFESSEQLKTDRKIVRYISEIACEHISILRSEPAHKQVAHSKRIFNHITEITKVVYENCIKNLKNMWSKFDTTSAYLNAECLRQSLLTIQTVYERKVDSFLKDIDNSSNGNPHRIIKVLQKIIEESFEQIDELNQQSDGKKIPLVLFQCLDILYDMSETNNEVTIEGYNWLFKFCQSHEIHDKDLGYVHKILFSLREKTHTGGFYDTIAMHLENILGRLDEEIELKFHFQLKSITEITAEMCILYLLDTLRSQIEQVDYLIEKVDSLHFKIKMSIEKDNISCVQSIKSMERSICSQLIHITNVLLQITNVRIPLKSCLDSLERIIILIYTCLTNLAKHFIERYAMKLISFAGIKFDELLKSAGKPLAMRIYNFILYIEESVSPNVSKQKKSDQMKVFNKTKFLPKLVQKIETFNKSIILLAKKTNTHFTHYLHLGTVRDFRIKPTELREIYDQTLSHGSQIEVDETETECSAENQDEIHNQRTKSSPLNIQENNSPSLSDQGVIEKENNEQTQKQLLENLNKINAKSKKRKSQISNNECNQSKKGKKGEKLKKLIKAFK